MSPSDYDSSEKYGKLVRSAYQWVTFATVFKRAADKIKGYIVVTTPRTNIDPYCAFVYMFLIGQALENLLKGLIVAADEKCVVCNEKKHDYMLNGKVGHHHLHKLAERVENEFKQYNLKFDETEYELLERLSDYVGGKGRYPAPLKSKPLFAERLLKGTDSATIASLWGRMLEALNSVVEEQGD